jgi:hypothetical protein
MIDLDATDEAALLKLTSKSSAEAVRATLEEIARRHDVDWGGWLNWKPSEGWPTILSWLAVQLKGKAYEALIGFAFESFWPTVSDPQAIPAVLDRFGESLHALAQFIAMADESAKSRVKAQAAEQRAKNAMAGLFISAGPAGARIAFSALNSIMLGKRQEWLSYGWQKAQSQFDAASIGDGIKAPAASGKTKTI